MDLERGLRNLGSASLMRLVSAALSFALFTFLARRWSATMLGEFATVFAVFTLLQQAPLLGLHFVLGRDVAARPETRAELATNAAVLSLGVSVVLAAAVAAAGMLLYPSSMWAAFGLLGLSLVPTALIVVAESLLWGGERMGTVMSVNAVESAFRVIGCLSVVLMGYGLTGIWVVWLAGRLLVAGIYLRLGVLGDAIRPRNVDPATLRRLLRISPIFLGLMMLGAAVSRIDFLLLSKLGTLRDVGLYSGAYRVFELALMVPMLTSFVLFPVLARTLAASEADFNRLTGHIFRTYIVAGFPLALLLAFLAPRLIVLLFGRPFAEAAIVLQILSIAPVLAGLDQILTSVQLARHRQGDDLFVLALACALYVILLCVLIPRFGFVGAGIATLAVALFQPALRYVVTRRRAGLPPLLHVAIRPALAALAMGGVLLASRGWGFGVGPILALIVYGTGLLLLGVVSVRDLTALRAVIASGHRVRP